MSLSDFQIKNNKFYPHSPKPAFLRTSPLFRFIERSVIIYVLLKLYLKNQRKTKLAKH